MVESEARQRQPEVTLADSQVQLLALWEHSADAMSLSDPNGIVVAANNAYCQLYGYTAEQVIGQSFAIIFPPEARDSVVAQYREIFETEDAPAAYESVVRTAAGEPRIVEARIGFIRQEGRKVAMLSIIRDITDRVRLEEERDELLARERKARTEAEEAIKSRDRFLSVVSHDLKNPLTAIKANAQLLRRHVNSPGGPKVERLNDGLSKIDETATRMNLALDDLMDFAGMQIGQRLSLQLRPTDMVALARRVVADRQQTTEHHRIAFEAATRKLVGTWDANRLERALENLLSNAVKYSPEGGNITVTLSTQERDGGPWAVIMVRDQGLGISDEDLPHIFEWFRRAGSVSGKFSGAGIGLASTRNIVEQHNGTIEVESEVGVGSTFTINLPLNAAES